MPKIPYVVSDFKPGDIIHVIGDYDDQDFDDVGTVITTSDYVDNPYSGGASILVRFDDKRDVGNLHDGGTGYIDTRRACDNRCWWFAEVQWNPELYHHDPNDNIIKKLNDNLPNAYDLISSLTESDAKNKFGLHSLKQGDKAIFSFQHQKGQKADNVIGTLLEGPDSYNPWYLIKFDNWHGGHDGHGQNPRCGKDDCFFLIAEDYPEIRNFDYIIVEPLVNTYELISSLFEADAKNKFGLRNLKEGDKAIFSFRTSNEVSNFAETDKVIGTALDNNDPYESWRLIKFDNWYGGHNGDGHPECQKNNCYFLTYDYAPQMIYFDYITVEPLVNAYDVISSLFEAEEDDYDWAYELSKNVDLKSAELTQIPKESMMMWYLILFDRPGLGRDVIEKSFKYIKDNTKWEFNCFSRNMDQCIDGVYDFYNQHGNAYIVLKPITHIGVKQGFGHTVKLFEGMNNKKITDKDIVIIRPY